MNFNNRPIDDNCLTAAVRVSSYELASRKDGDASFGAMLTRKMAHEMAELIARRHATQVEKRPVPAMPFDYYINPYAAINGKGRDEEWRLTVAVLGVKDYAVLKDKANMLDGALKARKLAEAEVARLRDVIKAQDAKLKELDTVKAAFAILVPPTVGPAGAPGADGRADKPSPVRSRADDCSFW